MNTCRWCKAPLGGYKKDAKFCGSNCRTAFVRHRKHGRFGNMPRKPVVVVDCPEDETGLPEFNRGARFNWDEFEATLGNLTPGMVVAPKGRTCCWKVEGIEDEQRMVRA